MAKSLSQNWWLVVLRGVFAILFGILAFVWPEITLLTLIVMFGVYAIIDGIVAIVTGLSHTKDSPRWWVFLLEGLISIGAGVVALIWPGLDWFRCPSLPPARGGRTRDYLDHCSICIDLRPSFGHPGFPPQKLESAEYARTDSLHAINSFDY